jgi:hypothetical protein
MKRLTIAFWVVNGLFAGFIALGAIPDAISIPEAVELFDRLGYPRYLLPFLGIAKLLGAAAVLLPVPRTIKEWAYAGLTFDLVGALYSGLVTRDPAWWGPVLPLILLVPAYILYRKRQSAAGLQFQTSTA